MFSHILVPLDGSACAEKALPVATRIARAEGGNIHLLSVITPMTDYTGTLAAGAFITLDAGERGPPAGASKHHTHADSE